MHFNFDFSSVQVLWTLTFAATLVLLVVLLGRDRARVFPWFTTSIAITGLEMVTVRLLRGRLAPIPLNTILLTLALIAGLVSVLVLVELARRAFKGASQRAWMIGAIVLLAASIGILAAWGPWPSWKTLTQLDSPIARLGFEQFAAQKLDLFSQMLTIGLGLVIVVFGRHYSAGFRSHTQRIAIGLSTAALTQTSASVIWQLIATHTVPKTQDVYEHVMGLRDKLRNFSSAMFVLVLVWWIVSLWISEPGADEPAEHGIANAQAQQIGKLE